LISLRPLVEAKRGGNSSSGKPPSAAIHCWLAVVSANGVHGLEIHNGMGGSVRSAASLAAAHDTLLLPELWTRFLKEKPLVESDPLCAGDWRCRRPWMPHERFHWLHARASASFRHGDVTVESARPVMCISATEYRCCGCTTSTRSSPADRTSRPSPPNAQSTMPASVRLGVMEVSDCTACSLRVTVRGGAGGTRRRRVRDDWDHIDVSHCTFPAPSPLHRSP